MKLYRTTISNTENNTFAAVQWHSSAGDASKARTAARAAGVPKASIGTEEVEITTGKTGILEALNKYAGMSVD